MSSEWKGMSSASGAAVEGESHLKQSIADILLTPVGSRLMRREYGSAIFSLLDQPDNEVTRLRLISAAVIALWKWEPRITPTQITFESAAQGARTMTISAQRSDSLSAITTDITI